MAETRWDRLVTDLRAAGFDAVLDECPIQGGFRRDITFRIPGKGIITVADAWWSKNPSIWLGWQVTAEDTGDIIKGRAALSKKRSETVEAVRLAFKTLGA